MPASTIFDWETAISRVEPDEVYIRGRPLTSLMGDMGFAEMMYLVLTGRPATASESRLLEATMISVMDHGISSSVLMSRMMASFGVPLQVGIGAGVLTFGDIHAGAGEQVANMLVAALKDPRFETPNADDISSIAANVVTEYRTNGQHVPGFGHPKHPIDPRARRLLELVREEGLPHPYCQLMVAIQKSLGTALGKEVYPNVDGISAALMMDIGIPAEFARLLLITPRTVGLAAHFVEELAQGHVMRHVPADAARYVGASAETQPG